jgi:glycosyltransferase involved in cell wall biosynthesis
MRIAILGTRGIPARYGGFETFAEELSTRLVLRGHDVTVYCREPYSDENWRGVHLRCLPALRHKYLETLHHTFVSTLDLLRHPHDVALFCNAANALFTPLPRLAGMGVALNVDGIERHRKKWNLAARCWYLMSEALATFCPNEIVTDAESIRDYYRTRYGRDSWFIPYGAPVGKVAQGPALAQLGLEPERYFLYVSRFEPENNALLVRRAFEQVATNVRLVLVGDAPYAPDYIRAVKDTRDPRILIPGAIYGEGYHELQSHSLAYVHATEVGGTHPALIEALGRGGLVLYLRTRENDEVAGGVGLPFTSEAELAAQMRAVLSMSEAERRALREAAVQRVRERYSWDAVTAAYERLFEHMLRREQTA